MLSGHLVSREREGDPGKIRPAADTTDDNVRVIVDHGKLLPTFLADDRLVETDMVQHRTERVVGVGVRSCILDRLRDCNPQRTRGIRVLFQNCPAGIGLGAGTRDTLRPPDMHHRFPVGFLGITRPDHVNGALKIIEHRCKGEG